MGTARALIAAGFLEYEREQARARQALGSTAPGKTLVETFPQADDAGKARDKAGERMHVSGRTVDDAAPANRVPVLPRCYPEHGRTGPLMRSQCKRQRLQGACEGASFYGAGT